jgi:hypothetical protein
MTKVYDEAGMFTLLTSTYRSLTGKELAAPSQDANWLYERAPFAVLAHDCGADPSFFYANRAAQTCFEYSWDEFVGLPSRLSAEPSGRDERQRLLDAVTRQGYIDDYRGLRVAKSGRRFMIEDVTVWQLHSSSSEIIGQAAMFSAWTDI